MRGWKGEGGEVGNKRGSACSTMTAMKTNTTTTSNTTTRRMGRDCAGERTMGGNPTMTVATSSAGRPLAAWGRGCRSTAPMPLPPSLMTTTSTTIANAVGGRHALPPPVHPVPPDAACRRQCCRPRSMAAARGYLGRGCTWGGGGSSMPLYSFVRF
jgi:hypothetical protein